MKHCFLRISMFLDLTVHRTVNLNVRYKVATFLLVSVPPEDSNSVAKCIMITKYHWCLSLFNTATCLYVGKYSYFIL